MFEKRETTEVRVAIGPLDVRRLAALDLHGWSGSRRRRRLIMFEFVLAVAVGLGLGVSALVAAGNPGVRVLGVAMVGIGLNYVALTVHALGLSRPGALDAELAGIDLGPQLKRYTLLALWLVVPFLVAVLALLQQRRATAGS